jgi:hypothetical protein
MLLTHFENFRKQFKANANWRELIKHLEQVNSSVADFAEKKELAFSVADAAASILISQDELAPTTPAFNFINWSHQKPAGFWTGELVPVSGVYEISIFVNAVKSGGGGVDGRLSFKLKNNGAVVFNSQRYTTIKTDGAVSAAFSGLLPLVAGDALVFEFVDEGSGTLTAVTDTNNQAFRLQMALLYEEQDAKV